MKKKLLIFLVCCGLLISLTGCGKGKEKNITITEEDIIGTYTTKSSNGVSSGIELRKDNICVPKGFTSYDVYFSPFFLDTVDRDLDCKYELDGTSIKIDMHILSHENIMEPRNVTLKYDYEEKTLTYDYNGQDKVFYYNSKGNNTENCENKVVDVIRECAGCVNPKEVKIYQSSCGGNKFYYDKYGEKHNYYVNSINWEDID